MATTLPICPECGQDDIYEAGWTPMQGAMLECADCLWTFSEDPEPSDTPFTDALWAAAGPNPRRT